MNHLNELILANLFLLFTWLAYDLVFSRIRLFQANRFFLLGGSVISLILPWLPWHLRIGHAEGVGFPLPLRENLPTVPVNFNATDGLPVAGLSWTDWIMLAYASVVVVLLVISVIQVIQLVYGSKSHKATRFDRITIVPMNRSCSAYSFFRTVYFPEPFDPGCRETRVILEHEKVHIRQWHTIDNLLFTLLRILFFYNPAVYLLTNRIRLVHEYIADQATAGADTADYSHLLIRHQFLVPGLMLMHSFNTKSFLTRRITMLSKNKHSRGAGWSYLLAAPVLAAMILLSGWSATAQDQDQAKRDKTYKELTSKLRELGFTQTPDGVWTKDGITAMVMVAEHRDSELIAVRRQDIKPTQENENEDEEKVVFQIVEEMPSFQGGDIEKFRKYIQRNVKYPALAMENQISGTVYVNFVVNRSGEVTDINIIRGVDPILDDETVKALKAAPKWVPGKQRGKPVNVSFSIPVKFSNQ